MSFSRFSGLALGAAVLLDGCRVETPKPVAPYVVHIPEATGGYSQSVVENRQQKPNKPDEQKEFAELLKEKTDLENENEAFAHRFSPSGKYGRHIIQYCIDRFQREALRIADTEKRIEKAQPRLAENCRALTESEDISNCIMTDELVILRVDFLRKINFCAYEGLKR